MANKIWQSMHHNFIMFGKSPAIIVAGIVPLLLLIITGSIRPVAWILPTTISLSVIIICFLSVGLQYEEYRKTKFARNITNTDLSMAHICLGTFLVVFFTTMAISLFLMIFTWFFTLAVPLLCQTIDNINVEGLSQYESYMDDVSLFSTFSFADVEWIHFFYSLVITIVMTSLFAIMFSVILNTQKSYILVSMIYILMFILFSGLIIPVEIIERQNILSIISKLIPNVHTNNLISSSVTPSFLKTTDDYVVYLSQLTGWGESTIDYLGTNSDKTDLVAHVMPFIKLDGQDPFDISLFYAIAPWVPSLLMATGSVFTALVNDIIQVINSIPGLGLIADGDKLSFVVDYLSENYSQEAITFMGTTIYMGLALKYIEFTGDMGTILQLVNDLLIVLYNQGIIIDTGITKYVYGVYLILKSLEGGFENLSSTDYAFAQDQYSLMTNLIPYLFSIISIPISYQAVKK